MDGVHCSIVMATRNRVAYLKRTLDSIFRQRVPFKYEVIVVDDGSTDNTARLCEKYRVRYIRLNGHPEKRNGCEPRNIGWKAARGNIIIAQSDEVIHHTPNAIDLLCRRLKRRRFVIATVYNYSVKKQERLALYTGKANPRPFFFLGSVWRGDLYAVGGEDEEFTAGGYNDNWLGVCLMRGLNRTVQFAPDIIGYHQDHPRAKPQWPPKVLARAKALFAAKKKKGVFVASGGPWENIEQVWDRRHSSGSRMYLGGSTGEQVWSFLDIDSRLQKGAVVLEIGVGIGECTRDIAARGVKLSALDISAVGLARVKECTEAQYHRVEQLPIDTFDVAISHLVAQHMTDRDLVVQMRGVLKSLKPSGILAMQFASGVFATEPKRQQHLRAQRGGGVCRSPSDMQKLVDAAGGRITWQEEPLKKTPTAFWHAIHIRRVQ